jgi:Flp pilus assembly protein TadG
MHDDWSSRADWREPGAMSMRGRRDGRGQALVEFALVFPALVLLLFGIVDFGRAIYDYNTLANAARVGVRVAIVNQNGAGTGCATGSGATPPASTQVSAHDCAIQAAIAMGSVTATVSYMAPTATTSCSPVQVGCLAVVTTSYTFRPITPIISSIVGAIPLSSTSTEPVEFVCPQTASTCVPGQ